MAKNIIIRDINPAVARALKVRAAQEDMTLSDLLKQILTEAVDKEVGK